VRGVWFVVLITLGACAAGPEKAAPRTSAPAASAGTTLTGPADDRDDDGVLDPDDRCPREPETYNGAKDDDGCPDTAPRPGAAAGSPAEIEDRVLFGRSRAEITPQSRAAIDRLSARLKAEPDLYPVVALDGHAAPDEQKTMPLSLARASAVREALIQRGIDPGRLIARASGAAVPVCRNPHERCLAQNRRVEVAVLPVQPPQAAEVESAPAPVVMEPAAKQVPTEEERPQPGAPPTAEHKPVTSPLEKLAFKKGSISLGPKALPVLDLLAGFLKSNPVTLEIDGHAGGDEPRPSELARARAEAVRAYLAACGVSGGSLIVRSFGAEAPLCRKKSEGCKALNRRVELRLP
jgi:outer membrane protein OmpA-like peptidoglycan-associated protein